MPAAPALFISDLHLTPERPEASARFFRFLAGTARRASALYILGDFFEAWVGDDDLDLPLHAEVAVALKGLTDTGVPVQVMHGNRDFLLGAGFCRASGATLLADPTVLSLADLPTLLMHGDSLCTDDAAYQRIRAQVRDPAWQAQILAKPLAERRAIARQLRLQSEQVKEGNRPEIMDVNAQAVADAFASHACRRIIHGHTHRPGRHTYRVGELDCERWVLPDWYETGGYLACDSAGCALHDLG
jgi:UDP-2,3-diacylglucosamine hydrolase